MIITISIIMIITMNCREADRGQVVWRRAHLRDLENNEVGKKKTNVTVACNKLYPLLSSIQLQDYNLNDFEGIIIARFSNLEILAKMEEEMEEKERLERGEPPKEKKEEEKVEEKKVEGEKETAAASEVKKEESAQASAVNSGENLKMSRENSYDR